MCAVLGLCCPHPGSAGHLPPDTDLATSVLLCSGIPVTDRVQISLAASHGLKGGNFR